MAHAALGSLLHFLRRFHDGAAAEATDGELLRRYGGGDQEAFAMLMRRHAAMVWGVCRRLLDNEQDAEDAFQAAFLVLLRKVESLRAPQSLAAYLHGVAYRIGQKARVTAQRRRHHEAQVETRSASDSMVAVELRELCALLDEELDRLPEKYRAPLVLCYLEGQSYVETARQLGWREGTVCGRLARARELLRQRLRRRGLTLSSAALAAALTEPSNAPAAIVTAVKRIAALFALGQTTAGTVSVHVATLAQGALQAMSLAKLKTAVALGMVLSLFAAGAGWTAHWMLTEKPASTQPAGQTPQAESSPQVRKDYYGDPFPSGVVARMGSRQLRHLRAHVAFAPNGKTLISAGPDRRVCFWDVATGRLIRDKRVRALPADAFLYFEAAALSSDGKTLAVNDGKIIYLHDAATGRECGRASAVLPTGNHFCLSADGKNLAVFHEGQVHSLNLWETSRDKAFRSLIHQDRIGTFVFSAGGQLLASTTNGLIHIWDTSTGAEVGSFRDVARSLVFSPHGKLLAAADKEGVVTLWESATRTKWATLKPSPGISGGYYSGDRGLAFSPDGSLLAVAGNEALVLWDVAAQKELRRLLDRGARNLAFAPDGKTLASASELEIRLWDVVTGKQLHQRPGHDSELASITVSPHGKILASIDWKRSLRLWDAAIGKPLGWCPAGRFRSVTSAFSPDGKWFIAGGDGAVQFWEAASGEEGRRFIIEDLRDPKRKHEVWELALSPDGRRLTALSTNDFHFQLSVWDTRTGQSIARRPYQARAPVYASVLTPDGAAVIVLKAGPTADARLAGEEPSEGTLILEEAATGQPLLTVPRMLGYPLTFSPDGKLLAAGIHRTPGRERGSYAVRSVSVIEAATGEEVLCIDGPLAPVQFSPGGRLLASIDAVGDGGLRIWDVATGKQVFRRAWPDDAPRHPGWSPAQSLAFFPDGRRLATGMNDGTVLVWDLAPETWPKTDLAQNLDHQRLDALWSDLAGNARKAHRAIYTLAVSPKQALPFLAEHLHPVAPVDAKRVDKLLADLDSGQFSVRDAAARELEGMGTQIEPALRHLLESKPSLEVRNRVRAIQEKQRGVPPAATLRALRAIRVLEAIGTAEARQVLENLEKGARAARQSCEAKAALQHPRSR